MPPLRIIDESAIAPQTDRAIRDGLCACFPADIPVFSNTRAWHGSAPAYSVLIEDGPLVLAHLGVVQRTIRVGGESLNVAGVQNVFVRPEYRGQGLVDAILRAAMHEAARRQLDLGLLFCLPALAPIYARNGWQTIPPRRTWATRASGQRYALDDKNIPMFHPLIRPQFPAGEIDLNGDDW